MVLQKRFYNGKINISQVIKFKKIVTIYVLCKISLKSCKYEVAFFMIHNYNNVVKSKTRVIY